jgi:hypothetical protein
VVQPQMFALKLKYLRGVRLAPLLDPPAPKADDIGQYQGLIHSALCFREWDSIPLSDGYSLPTV